MVVPLCDLCGRSTLVGIFVGAFRTERDPLAVGERTGAVTFGGTPAIGDSSRADMRRNASPP